MMTPPTPVRRALVLALVLPLWRHACADDSRREHKVHNIVLYPDLHSWCQTIPIKQIVAAADHESATIDNNVCVGACYSYSIPRTQPAEPGELIGPYCDSCQPKETQCYHVTLASTAAGGKSTLQKRVQIITSCACATCGAQQLQQQSACEADDGSTSELPASMRSSSGRERVVVPSDVPELMSVGATPIDNSVVGVAEAEPARATYTLSEPVHRLLDAMSTDGNDDDDDDGGGDDDQLRALAHDERMRELLAAVVKGSHTQRASDADVMQFANYVNDHYDDLDVDALRLKRVLEMYAAVLEGGAQHGRHVVGEEQRLEPDGGVGRLVIGPHGSLVVAPAEAKLSLATDDVAPNHEGVVIDYHHHHHHQLSLAAANHSHHVHDAGA